MGTKETWKLLEGTKSILRHCPVVTTAGAHEMTASSQVCRGCFHITLPPASLPAPLRGQAPMSHMETHQTQGTGQE